MDVDRGPAKHIAPPQFGRRARPRNPQARDVSGVPAGQGRPTRPQIRRRASRARAGAPTSASRCSGSGSRCAGVRVRCAGPGSGVRGRGRVLGVRRPVCGARVRCAGPASGVRGRGPAPREQLVARGVRTGRLRRPPRTPSTLSSAARRWHRVVRMRWQAGSLRAEPRRHRDRPAGDHCSGWRKPHLIGSDRQQVGRDRQQKRRSRQPHNRGRRAKGRGRGEKESGKGGDGGGSGRGREGMAPRTSARTPLR